MRNITWKLFWKIGKCNDGGNAWIGSRVYLVYLEIFWEFSDTWKMVLFSSVCTCEVQVALLPVADAWVRVAVSQVPVVANTDRWTACLSLFISHDQRSSRKRRKVVPWLALIGLGEVASVCSGLGC